jgi:pyruvate/2-oxoacid:ferredoxin oxidoreductase alpha subunit
MISLHLDFEEQSVHAEELRRKWERMDAAEPRSESYLTDDADVVFVAFGIVSRLCKNVVNQLREKGLRAGLFRPITLSPFPYRQIADLAGPKRRFEVVELNMGQMAYDVRLAVGGRSQVGTVQKLGGLLPTTSEIIGKTREMMAIA